jgi:hypothetical protein
VKFLVALSGVLMVIGGLISALVLDSGWPLLALLPGAGIIFFMSEESDW